MIDRCPVKIDRTRGGPEPARGEGGVERAWARVFACCAGLLASGLLACAPGGPAPAAAPGAVRAGPLLWLAEAPEGEAAFFLLGSVHLGDRRMLDLGDAVDEAFAASDELVVEIDLSRVQAREALELSQRYALLPPPKTVQDVVSEETWRALTDYLESRGLAREPFVGMKPWFLSFSIVQVELGRAGYQTDLGVDRLFIEDAASQKPIVALETVASQLAVLDAISPEVQELMLSDTLSRADSLAGETDQLVEAWSRGDEQRIHDLVFQDLERTPELDGFYESVFFERNRQMAARLLELAKDGRMRFVVLGAGHMVGEEGIPALLARSGYEVRRVGR